MIQGKFQGPPIVGPPFPYYSHTTPIRIGSAGMVWEADMGRGSTCLGVPGEIPDSDQFLEENCKGFD